MRRLFILLLTIVLSLTFVACVSRIHENLLPENSSDNTESADMDNGDGLGNSGEGADGDRDTDQNTDTPADNGKINIPGGGSPEEAPDAIGSDSELPLLISGSVLKIPGQGKEAASLISVSQGDASLSAGKIALTFDAGWIYEPTADLLDVLKSHGVKAAFFPRALWVRDNPELARRITAEGHLIGNHSLTHGHLVQMSEEEVRNEIREAGRIISDLTGAEPFLFRPPYGEMNETIVKVLEEEGYRFSIMWTVDSLDWKEPGTENIISRVLSKGAVDGSIVLMHVGTMQTPEALPEIIAGFRSEGYHFVRLDEILPQSVPGSSGDLLYTVNPGDTFYSLSRRFGVSIGELIEYNNL